MFTVILIDIDSASNKDSNAGIIVIVNSGQNPEFGMSICIGWGVEFGF